MNRLIALICFAGFIILGISATISGPTLPNLAEAISLPLADAGILRAVRQIGAVSATFLAGWLLDRHDIRRVMIPGALLLTFGLVLIVSTGNPLFVLAAMFIAGAGSGLYDVGTNYTIGAVFAASAAAVLAALHTFYGLGSSIGPLVAAWALNNQAWHSAYLIGALLCLIMAAAFVGLRGVPQPHTHKASDLDGAASAAIPLLPLFCLAALIFMYAGAGTGLSDWLFTHLRLVANANVDTASGITSLYWIGLTGGRVVSIFVLRRLGSLLTMQISLALSTIGAVLLVVSGTQIVLIAIGVVLIGVGFAPVYPTVIALGGQLSATARGRITGLLSGAAAFGAMTVPVIQGWVGNGQNGGMIVTLIATVIMVGALVGVVRTQSAPAQTA